MLQIKGNDVCFFKVKGNYHCKFETITGKKCAGCGNTRSITSFFDGHFMNSIKYNPIGFFISLFFCFDFLLITSELFDLLTYKKNITYLLFLFTVSILTVIRYHLIN